MINIHGMVLELGQYVMSATKQGVVSVDTIFESLYIISNGKDFCRKGVRLKIFSIMLCAICNPLVNSS